MMQLKNQILRMILQHSNVFGGRFSLRCWEKHVNPSVAVYVLLAVTTAKAAEAFIS